MHSVNLDLLATTPHHADGSPRDPHAHHKAELCALARTARRARWRNRFARLKSLMRRNATTAPQPQPCPDHGS